MKIRITLLALATVLLASRSLAAVLVSDDFNDGAISTNWTVENDAVDSTATEDGPESAFTSTPGGYSLKLDDNSNTAEVNLRYTMPAGQSIAEGDSLTIEFDWYSVDATLPIIEIEDAGSNAARLSLLGDFNHREGASWSTLDTTSGGTWYRVSYTYHNNAGSDTADISLTPLGGATTTWSNRSVEADKTSINSILFQFNTNPSNIAKEWYIDNVTISDNSYSNDSWFETLRTTRVESDPSLTWRQFGPGMSGNNYRIYWHPTDPDVVFLGPNMGNAYRSEDRGTTYDDIQDYDAQGHVFDDRGPTEINSPDFSRQNPDFGFCSREAESKLYVTTDKGKTWSRHLTSDSVWGNEHLNTIAVAPSDDQIWFVGSGDMTDRNKFFFSAAQPHGYASYANHDAKIWKTTDQGTNWTDITPTINANACIVRIIVHPTDPSIVWAATTYGLYKSTNGGTSWVTKTGSGLDHDIIRSFDMHYDAATSNVTLYAVDLVKWVDVGGTTVANDGGGIFRSEDEGESWTNINGDLGVDISVLSSDWNFKNSYWNALKKWFGISDASTKYNSDFPTNMMHSFAFVRVDPNDASKIFILNDYKHYGGATTMRGGMVWRTDNGGTNWFATLRNGTAWEDGGAHQSYWEGRGNPTAHNMFLRGQKKWEQRESYERKAGSVMEFNADGSVLMFQWAKVLCLSFDGGDHWYEVDEIEVTPHSEIWVAAENSNLPGHGLHQDSRFPETLFMPCGENDFWVLEPGGDSVRSGFQAARRVELGSSEYSCSSIAIHPDDTNTIYTLQFRQASAGDLLKSTDGGQSFVEHGIDVLPWPASDPNRNTTIDQLCLTINPDDPDYMFFCVPQDAAVHGFTWDPGISLTTGVRRTTDGGVNWDWANIGLPSEDVVCLRLDPSNSTNLYACVYGNGGGLYMSTNNAVSWNKQPTLPSNIFSVSDIHFSSDGKMYVSCGYHNDSDYANGGVWVSDDNGTNWTQMFKTKWARMTKTAAYDPDVILVAMNGKGTSDIQNPGTYLSKDGGLSWIKFNTGNGQSDRINDIAIDQVLSNRYYVSTQGCGWLRADVIDTNNVAPLFAGSLAHSNAVPEILYTDSVDEAMDANGDSIDYSLIIGPDWISVAANGSLSATPPTDALGSYLCQVQADDGVGLSSRELLRFVVSTNSGAYYASWMREFPGVGSATGHFDDPDNDGLNNLGEYGFGGNPNLPNSPADLLPKIGKSGGDLEYIYRVRADAAQRGLEYDMEATDDLTSNDWNPFEPSYTTGTVDGNIDVITHSIPTSYSNLFWRLNIGIQ